MWGARAEGGFFTDVQVLLVVVVGSAILLGSLAMAIAVHAAARDRAAAQAEADALLQGLLESPALTQGRERALLDLAALESLDADRLRDLLGTDRPARLVVAERTGDTPRTFDVSTAPLGGTHGFRSTAGSVWHSETDVRAARVSLALGG